MSFISPASSPACASSAHINMHVIGARVPGSVDAQASDELGMFELNYLYGQTYHSGVNRGDSAVTIGINGHVGGVAVLVLTVARGAPDAPIVLGSAEAGVHVDVDVSDGLVSVPAGDLLDHQLQLVQQLRVHRRVTRPNADLVMIQEVANLEMLGDRELHIGRADLQKSFRRRRLAAHPLGEVRTDAVAAQHSLFFFREGDQHCQRETLHGTTLTTLQQLEMVKPGFRWRGNLVACERLRSCAQSGVANSDPGVLEGSGISMDVERIGDFLGRQCERKLDLSAGAEGADRRLGDRYP